MRDISSQEDGIQHLSIELDSLCHRIWDVSPAHSVDALTRKSAKLSMRSGIYQALDHTARCLSQFEASSLSGLRSKLCEFIRAVYGSLENDKNKSRWQKLRDIDCTSFLFIGLAYTPVDIGEMGRTQFNYLLDNIAKFQRNQNLPPKWFFLPEIQLAVAAKARLLWATDFRRSMYSCVCLRGVANTNRVLCSGIQRRRRRRELGIDRIT